MTADLTWGVSEWVFGPMGTTLANVSQTAGDTINRPKQVLAALRKLGSREFTVARDVTAIANKIDRQVFDENNRTVEYGKWRGRTYDYLDERDAPDAGDKLAQLLVSVIEGTPDFQRSDRTLTYEYAAQQVTANDVDDAAAYLAALMRDRTSYDDRRDLLLAIRQSARSKSPLGRVPKKERDAFLSRFPAEDRAEAKKLQRVWLARYNRAIRQAAKDAGWPASVFSGLEALAKDPED